MGLGNPGPVYHETRHNVGFHVIDHICSQLDIHLKKVLFRPLLRGKIDIDGNTLVLVKPLTFMNRSGIVIPFLLKHFSGKERRFLVICDNMDLTPGELRLKQKGSSAGHNGIKSVMEYMNRGDFFRLYIGVGRPAAGDTVVEHVLGTPDYEESIKITRAEERASQAVLLLLNQPVNQVMNECNRRQTEKGDN